LRYEAEWAIIPHMKRFLTPLILASAIVLASAAVTLAEAPGDNHGAEVKAVAMAVENVIDGSHGKAVSAIAKTHGLEVSAAAQRTPMSTPPPTTAQPPRIRQAEGRGRGREPAVARNPRSTTGASRWGGPFACRAMAVLLAT
jgi:hypothetical protein